MPARLDQCPHHDWSYGRGAAAATVRPMATFGIAVLQLEGQTGNNVDSMIQEIDIAVLRFPWVKMLVLAELNAFGARVKDAVPLPGEPETRFCEAARRNGIWLIPGSIYEKAGDQVFNTASVINPAGEVVARYRKTFPWCPYEREVAAGSQLCVFDVPGIGRFGLTICYDSWFPELVRSLAVMGAEVILNPTMTSTIDRDVEVSIARASAAINQCYFISVNAAQRLGLGESCICGPGGELIYRAGKTREIVPVEVDFDYVRRVRRRGWHGLTQPLKSFRDSNMDFTPYLSVDARREALRDLGALEMPGAGPATPTR